MIPNALNNTLVHHMINPWNFIGLPLGDYETIIPSASARQI